MENYKPPFKITDDMLMLISQIAEKVAKVNPIKKSDAKLHLRKNNQIKSIHSSLKIEANSLSLPQVRDIIKGKYVLGEQREIQEVKNAYDAYERLSDIDPYEVEELKKFHEIMTRYILQDCGKFRSGEEGVFSGDKCIFMAPPAKFVQELMMRLFAWMKENREKIHPLIMSAVFHYEFVFIHPFSDGNGRMARLWHTALLSKWNSIFEYIPLESQIEKFQQEYYEAIAQSHTDGESTRFIEFMLVQTDGILDSVFLEFGEKDAEISERVRKLLKVMKKGIQYTSTELMERLGLKSKEGFRRNYIKPAIERGAVCMTNEENPRSRNQKYVKK